MAGDNGQEKAGKAYTYQGETKDNADTNNTDALGDEISKQVIAQAAENRDTKDEVETELGFVSTSIATTEPFRAPVGQRPGDGAGDETDNDC